MSTASSFEPGARFDPADTSTRGSGQRQRLAVVVVTYNSAGEVLGLLADLAYLQHDPACTVYVVDNASTDETVAEIREAFPWVRLQSLDVNIGFGSANNRVILGIDTTYALLLNPDTRVTPVAVTECLRVLDQAPDIGVLTPRVVDGEGVFDRRCMRGFPTPWAVLCHVTGADRLLRGRRAGRYLQRWVDDSVPGDVEAVSGAVMFCRTDAIRGVDGFDERFFLYGEDIDICLRLSAAGWRIRYWPDATVVHLGGRSGSSPKALRSWARAFGDLYRIHRPGIQGLVGAWFFYVGGAALRMARQARSVLADSTASR